ncbi:hypothetical protein ColLi_06583 [Colletotrichum liriopes]|uniref:Uncharacterized protein n=1 Tax=Colletotrichum liriopes TaxID=708192 RepID=A0AA37GN86_9PEZI|nr:hypothetical protein ColLi_06583 [Colletotrichum liriopes]
MDKQSPARGTRTTAPAALMAGLNPDLNLWHLLLESADAFAAGFGVKLKANLGRHGTRVLSTWN